MSDSYLLLAVKRAMGLGTSAIQGGNRFESFYGVSSLDVAQVPMGNMPGYIGVMIDEVKYNIHPNLVSFAKDIAENLEMVRDLEAYHYPADKICCNTIYDKNQGKMNLWVYKFTPIHNEKDCQCEQMSINLQFRLADDIVILYHKKKSWFGSKSWTEHRRIPAVVRAADFINALCIVIAPLLETSLGVQTPTNLASELKESARQHPDVLPSDVHRRTVIDPFLQKAVVLDDPALLALIPPKWETSNGFDLPNTNWEF